MVKFWRFAGLLILLAACTPRIVKSPLPTPTILIIKSPLPTPTALVSPLSVRQVTPLRPLTPQPGMGGIQGQIAPESVGWAGRELYVYASPFSGSEGGQEGFYILEPSIHPNTMMNPDGTFQLAKVPPGDYVLVVGPSPEGAVPIQESGRAKIFHVAANQVLDLGKVNLK